MQKLPRDLQAYVVGVVFISSALLIGFSAEVDWQAWPELLLFLVLITWASMLPIPDPRGGFITAAGTLFYVLISVHGPASGLLVAGSAYAAGAIVSRGWVPWKAMFNGAQMGLSVGVAGLVFRLAGGSVIQPSIGSFLVPLTLAVIANQVANNFLVAFYFSRLKATPFLPAWLSDMKDLLLSNILSIPTAALLAILYVFMHPLTLLIFLGSLPLQRRAHALYLQQKRIFDQAINSLAVALEASSPGGRGHSRRVADTAVSIARQLGLSYSILEGIELGSLLHDVGMIGLDELLERYSEESAYEELKKHVQIGAEIAKELPRRYVREIVLHHHESFDGSGYPSGLRGKEIPVGARVVGVAEAFESLLVGAYPYRNDRSVSDTIRELRAESGKKYDPDVVSALFAALRSGSIEHLSGSLGGTEAILEPGSSI